jgi:MOSC domain-containing protein YiiM
MSQPGRIAGIHVASEAGGAMVAVPTATAIAGIGLDGDRYAIGAGHWSSIRRAGDQLTLIEDEEVERVAAQHGLDLPRGATRRNLTTRGIRLDELIGRRFRIGAVACIGVRRCEPCTYLDGLLGQEALEALVHRAGIRAEIVTGGSISVGDPVAPTED